MGQFGQAQSSFSDSGLPVAQGSLNRADLGADVGVDEVPCRVDGRIEAGVHIRIGRDGCSEDTAACGSRAEGPHNGHEDKDTREGGTGGHLDSRREHN